MKRNLLWLALFAILYFGLRAPDLITPLHYEEGAFGEIFYAQPPNPNYILLGRIDGINLYSSPEHPAIIYEILSHYGQLWKVLVNYQTLNVVALTFIVRLAFSIFQFLVAGVILLMILLWRDSVSWRDKITLLAWISVLVVTPPAMTISTSVQVDGSVGTLLAGLLAIALLGHRLELYPLRTASVLVLITSLLFGFGKNEWSLALLLALLSTTGYLYLTTRKRRASKNYNPAWRLLGLILAGLLLGNLVSYLYDKGNYLAGFDVMFRISKASNYNFISFGIERLAFAYVNLLLLAFIAVALIRAWKSVDYILFLYFSLGAILFLAYFVTSWAIEPRYYAASLSLCLAGTVVAYEHLAGAKTRWLMLGISFVLLAVTGNQMVQNKHRMRLYLQLELQKSRNEQITTIPPGCIPTLGLGEAFGQEIDFISNSLSPEGAADLVAKYNRIICKP